MHGRTGKLGTTYSVAQSKQLDETYFKAENNKKKIGTYVDGIYNEYAKIIMSRLWKMNKKKKKRRFNGLTFAARAVALSTCGVHRNFFWHIRVGCRLSYTFQPYGCVMSGCDDLKKKYFAFLLWSPIFGDIVSRTMQSSTKYENLPFFFLRAI